MIGVGENRNREREGLGEFRGKERDEGREEQFCVVLIRREEKR